MRQALGQLRAEDGGNGMEETKSKSCCVKSEKKTRYECLSCQTWCPE